MASKCPGDEVCSDQRDCAPCLDVLSSGRTLRTGSTPAIPVRRFGSVPPLDDDLQYELEPEGEAEASARTIAEYGAAAVWMAALSAACVAGLILYLG